MRSIPLFLLLFTAGQASASPADFTDFTALSKQCAPHVAPETMAALVKTESGFNPYAIGVVGGALMRQPQNRAEALATVKALVKANRDFSVGLGQINQKNFKKYNLTAEGAFDPCLNLNTAGKILGECFSRASSGRKPAQKALRDAFSCYYSGNFQTGYRHGYVNKVVANALNTPEAMIIPGIVPEKSKKGTSIPVRLQSSILRPAEKEDAEKRHFVHTGKTVPQTGLIF